MAGLIRNIFQRSRGENGSLSPRNPGMFAPPNQPVPSLTPYPKAKMAPEEVITTPRTSNREQTKALDPSKPSVQPSTPKLKEPLTKQPFQVTENKLPLVAETHNLAQAQAPDPPLPQLRKESLNTEPTSIPNEGSILQRPNVISPEIPKTSVVPPLISKPLTSEPLIEPSIQRAQTQPPTHIPTVDLDAKLGALMKRIEQAENRPDTFERRQSKQPLPSTSSESEGINNTTVKTSPIPRLAHNKNVAPRPLPQPSLPKINSPQLQPPIEVSIGSIEFVEAPPIAVPTPRQGRPKAPTPNLTLSEYLKR